jgi:hypothetical protein
MARRRTSQLPSAVAALTRSPQNPTGTSFTPTAGGAGSGQALQVPGGAPTSPPPPASAGPQVASGGRRTNFLLQGPPLPGVGIGPALTRIKR